LQFLLGDIEVKVLGIALLRDLPVDQRAQRKVDGVM
jgi:hypothetical protein